MMSKKLRAAPKIDNYLGFYGISGRSLQNSFQQHIESMDIKINPDRVQMVYNMGSYFTVAAGSVMYEATTIILAPGVFSAKKIQGESELLGRGVGYCATCDAALYKGKTVAVAAYTDSAAIEADFLAGVAGRVYYLPQKKVAMPKSNTEIVQGKIIAITGGEVAEYIVLENRKIPVDGVFIIRDSLAPDSLMPGLVLENGFIKVDADMCTNFPGCYAAGDCTGYPHQYMRAAGQGQTAALNAVEFLDQLG